MSKRVKITGVSQIQKNFTKAVKLTAKNVKHIALDPTQPIIEEIKENLRDDQINGKKFKKKLNHIFEGELLRNTRAEIGATFSSGLDHLVEIRLGYFVNYGLNLEAGSGSVRAPWTRIKKWAYSRPSPQPDPARVQRKLAFVGVNAYPIITPVFFAKADEYKSEVFKRVSVQWA